MLIGWPVDRESPLFEAVIDDQILFDVGRSRGNLDVAFHTAISGYVADIDVLRRLMEQANELIRESEHRDEADS